MNEPFPLQLADSRASWEENQKRLRRTWAFVVSNHKFVWPEVKQPAQPEPFKPEEVIVCRMIPFRLRSERDPIYTA